MISCKRKWFLVKGNHFMLKKLLIVTEIHNRKKRTNFYIHELRYLRRNILEVPSVPRKWDILSHPSTSNGRQSPMEDDLKWKTTSNGRRLPKEDDLQWKTTSNGRPPPNIKSWISPHPPNLSIQNWTKITCLKGRQPPMEDDPKKLKAEYLSNHGSDFSQI